MNAHPGSTAIRSFACFSQLIQEFGGPPRVILVVVTPGVPYFKPSLRTDGTDSELVL